LIGIYRPGSAAPEDLGFDASIHNNNPPLRGWGTWQNPVQLLYYKLLRRLAIPTIYSYEEAMTYFLPNELPSTRYPSVINGWDNTPRSGDNGLALTKPSPQLYRLALEKSFALTQVASQFKDGRLIFLKSWNEWAEGNHLEPDLRDGHSYLQVVLEVLDAERRRLAE